MKMAKATETDLENAAKIANAIEGMTGGYMRSYAPDGEEFWREDASQCQKALHYLLDNSRGLNRVVFGCAVLLDPVNRIVDPSLDHLERHPKEHPTLDQCRQAGIGPGLPDTLEERERFEAYMAGHHWAIGVYDTEQGCYDSVFVRCAYGVWRDRGALAMRSE